MLQPHGSQSRIGRGETVGKVTMLKMKIDRSGQTFEVELADEAGATNAYAMRIQVSVRSQSTTKDVANQGGVELG